VLALQAQRLGLVAPRVVGELTDDPALSGSVVYVYRQSPVIEVDRSRLFNRDQSEVRAKLRGDLIAAIPNGVVRVTGMLPG
jgi:hypothetical protein